MVSFSFEKNKNIFEAKLLWVRWEGNFNVMRLFQRYVVRKKTEDLHSRRKNRSVYLIHSGTGFHFLIGISPILFLFLHYKSYIPFEISLPSIFAIKSLTAYSLEIKIEIEKQVSLLSVICLGSCTKAKLYKSTRIKYEIIIIGDFVSKNPWNSCLHWLKQQKYFSDILFNQNWSFKNIYNTHYNHWINFQTNEHVSVFYTFIYLFFLLTNKL